MAKTKNTPAYVKKAIEWLEKNAPDGEQIAFINDQEAAHLKAMGGSGEEVVDGVRSYQNQGIGLPSDADRTSNITIQPVGPVEPIPGGDQTPVRLPRPVGPTVPLTTQQQFQLFQQQQQQQQQQPQSQNLADWYLRSGLYNFTPNPNSPKTVAHQRSDEVQRIMDNAGGTGGNGFFSTGPFQGLTRSQAATQIGIQDQLGQIQQQQVQQQQQQQSQLGTTPSVPQFAPRVGGAAAIRLAEQTEPSELAIPTVPTAPELQVAQIGTPTDQQLISDQGLQVAAAPTIGPAQTVDTTGITPTAPTRVPAATTTATQVADTGPATAAQLAAPTRTIGDIQEAIPTEELAQAATAELDPRATVQFQLAEITSSIQEGQPLPLWAAPAARNADGLMLQRGLGASSMAASARTQALLEAGLPIASADAQSYGRIQLSNLSNQQAASLQNANNLAALRTQNLNARLTAAVNNAQNFLAIDTANLTNRQASNVLSFQANQQRLFNNQAAENASRQFNATSTNQVEQFFSTLENSVTQANANRLTAVRQFNVGEVNSQNQFIENQRLARESFNSQVQSSVRAANANWFKSIATIENANQMLSNSFAAQSALNLSNLEYQSLWQKRRDDAHYIFTSTENDLSRNAQAAIAAQDAAIARSQSRSQSRSSLFSTIGTVAAAALPIIFPASDIRLKTNIEKIGEFNSTIDLYEWEWNEVAEKIGVDDQHTVGVLAQELIEYRPDLVRMADDGYFRVNYVGLLS